MQGYNCLKSGHLSANCPEPQRRSRCPSCDKVDSHAPECNNSAFTCSMFSTSTTVFNMQNLLKIQFKGVADLFTVHDVRRKVEIDKIPKWLTTIDSYVCKTDDRTLDFA